MIFFCNCTYSDIGVRVKIRSFTQTMCVHCLQQILIGLLLFEHIFGRIPDDGTR